MDMTTISAAYTGVKIAKESLTAAFNFKVDKEAEKKINEALDKLGSIQDSVFEMREELFRLQEENRALKDEIAAHQNWESRLEKYELIETDGGAIVYISKTTPRHYVCPRCIEKREILPLQDDRVMVGNYSCPGCDKKFPVKSKKPMAPLPQGRGSQWP